MSIVWVIIFCLYAIGWKFEDNERRESALQVCFLSCLAGVILVRFPHLNTAIPSLGFAIVDFTAFVILFCMRFKVLSCLVFASVLIHITAYILTVGNFLSYLTYYSAILIFLNMGILSVLFVGSRGSSLVLEWYRYCVDAMPASQCRKNLARFESQLYNNELLQAIDKDFE
jgi:hypothetical protein